MAAVGRPQGHLVALGDNTVTGVWRAAWLLCLSIWLAEGYLCPPQGSTLLQGSERVPTDPSLSQALTPRSHTGKQGRFAHYPATRERERKDKETFKEPPASWLHNDPVVNSTSTRGKLPNLTLVSSSAKYR